MKVETKEIYSEVYQILNLLGTEYTEKLPATLMNMLKEKRTINYFLALFSFFILVSIATLSTSAIATIRHIV